MKTAVFWGWHETAFSSKGSILELGGGVKYPFIAIISMFTLVRISTTQSVEDVEYTECLSAKG